MLKFFVASLYNIIFFLSMYNFFISNTNSVMLTEEVSAFHLVFLYFFQSALLHCRLLTDRILVGNTVENGWPAG